jgi:hypothetical protein
MPRERILNEKQWARKRIRGLINRPPGQVQFRFEPAQGW